MQIKLWQFLLFAIIIFGIAVAIFPSKSTVISLHIQTELLEEARMYLSILRGRS